MVGDQFLKEIHPTLQAMLRSARKEHTNHDPKDSNSDNKLFMDSYFNVSSFWRTRFEGIKSPVRRIINSLIDAINKNTSKPLPRIILILPEADVLRHTAYFGYGASKVFGTIINALVKAIYKEISTRKEDMRKMKKGAVIESEPKVVWMKAIDRPGRDKFLSLRAKYNAVLEETIADYPFSYIMEIDENDFSRDHFDLNNHMRANGMHVYLKSFDRLLRRFDENPARFTPRWVVTEALTKNANENERYLLPKPPGRF